MKIYNYVFLIGITFLVQYGLAQHTKIELSSISVEHKTLVHEFINKAIADCSAIATLKLSSRNSTSRFRKFFTEEKLLEACHWYVERYGIVENSELIEAYKNGNFTIYRFKLKRSITEWDLKIRVVLDNKNRLAGIRSKEYWSDKFYPRYENLPIKKIDTSNIDKAALKLNHSFALKSYQKREPPEMLVADATNAIHRSLRKDWNKNLQMECDSVKSKNGNLSSFKFVELYSDSVSRYIHRYKVQFEKLKKPSDIRVYSKLNDKFMGFFVVDVWYDKYYEFDKAKSKSLNDLGR